MKYSDGKITLEQYLDRIDKPEYYGFLFGDVWEKIQEKHAKERQKEEQQKLEEKARHEKFLRRQDSIKETKFIFAFIGILAIIILTIIRLTQ